MSEPHAPVAGLSHLTFIAADLDRMEQVLVAVLGARRVYDSGAGSHSLSPERFYLVGDENIWIAVMQGEPLPVRTYNHVAFKVAAADLDRCREAILALGLNIREGRSRIAGESRSIYFHDHDNHLFELHTGTLAERLAHYGAASP